MKGVWRWLGQSKDQISALQALAAIVALGVGAGWILLHFDISSELVAEVRLVRTVNAYKALDNATILQVDVTLTNSSKRSATYYCQQTFILEFLPLSKEDSDILLRGVKRNTNFSYDPAQMKAMHYPDKLVVPANGSALSGKYWSVSPYALDYVAVDDKSTRIKSIVVRNRFYAGPECMSKLDRNATLPFEEVTSIFDMEANTSVSSTQQQAAEPPGLP